MKNTNPVRLALLFFAILLSFVVTGQAIAEDVDLYVGGEASTGSQTNVLIVLDNGPNWAANGSDAVKLGKSEMLAIKDVLSTLGDNVNVGLLMGTTQGGGYVRYSIREMGGTNRTAFQSMLQYSADNFGNDGENNDKITEGDVKFGGYLNAAFRYFQGLGVFNDRNPTKTDLRDYAGNVNNLNMQTAGAIAGNSLANAAATTYTPPADSKAGCAKNYIIFIGNGYDKADSPDDLTAAAQLLVNSSGTRLLSDATIASIVANVPGGDNARWADEWTRFMYTYGTYSVVDDPKSTTSPKARLWNKIATYTINVCQNAANCGANGATPNNNFVPQIDLMKSMAKVGGGKYFLSDNREGIKNALALIFAEIQAVNSVFASATLPISVNTQGTYENQVYIGVFRPDAGARPRWFGNLKEYKFGRYCDADNNDKVLIDSTRALVGGMITATPSANGTASGAVSGSFSGTITSASGVTSNVSGTVTGTVTGGSTVTLAAVLSGVSAGSTVSPAAALGSGTVTGTITGTGTGTGSSAFTGTLNATPSVSGTFTASDERVGDDIPAPSCGTGASLKLYLGDKNGYRAIDEEGNTGFIDLSAKSFWTSDQNFWLHNPVEPAGSSDSPDGPNVERGGAAQRLRNTWAATDPTSSRKLYTCLSGCLAAASTSDSRKLVDATTANQFVTSNAAVTAALPKPPTTALNVTSITRGNTLATAEVATVTTATAHGKAVNATFSVAIEHADQTDYNGTKTATSTGANTFTFPVTETPGADSGTVVVSGATSSYAVGTLSVASPVENAGVVTATATAAVSGYPVALALADRPSVTGAAQSFLNGGSLVPTAVSGTTSFSYAVDVTPKLPGTSTAMNTYANRKTYTAATYPTATNNSITLNITDIYYLPGSARVVVRVNDNGLTGSSKRDATNFNTGTTAAPATVSITNAFAPFTGNWNMVDKGASCDSGANTIPNSDKANWFCFALPLASLYTSPDAGASKWAAFVTSGTSFPISISRSAADTTPSVSVTGNLAGSLSSGDTVEITGANNAAYNGSKIVANVSHGVNSTFDFAAASAVALAPVTPATGTITATLGGTTFKPETDDLIKWTRGMDNWEDEDQNLSKADVRASIHGDVLHARPVVVNYGGATGIIGFYGSNDGYLRSVKGGTASTDGAEKWAFIPEEFVDYDRLARLRNNSEIVRYPNLSCNVSPTPKKRTYGWDGNFTVYQTSDGTASVRPSKTYLFASMRRGGRSVYALDITDPDTPKVLWRVNNQKINNDASSDYAELGQTWSEPKVIKLKGVRTSDSSAQSVIALAFGAGYDEDVEDKPTGTSRRPTKGRGVFIVNAETGARLNLLQPSGTPATGTGGAGFYSFAADVSAIDLDGDGYIDRIYAGDTGGNVWRFDAVQTAEVGTAGYWKIYNIARLGDIENDGGVNGRKFMFAPEILPFKESGVLKTMVLLGSGDREKPLPNFKANGSANAVTCTTLYSGAADGGYYPPGDSGDYKVYDRFFGLVDSNQSGAVEATVNSSPITLGQLTQINSDTLSSNALTPFSLSSGAKGWQIWLRNNPDGDSIRNEEKTVNQARVVAGVAYFATNTPMAPNPSAGVCSNLGEALGYAVEPFTGMPALNRDNSTQTVSGNQVATITAADYATKFSGGGLPPTVTAGVVTIGGTPYRFIIGSGGASLTSASSISGQRNVVTLRGTRSRLYWSYGADN